MRYARRKSTITLIQVNLLNREFEPEAHNTHWVGDITYCLEQLCQSDVDVEQLLPWNVKLPVY